MQIDKNNWQIKIDKENRDIVSRYIGYRYDIGSWYGLYNGKIYYDVQFPNINIPIITTDQFRKYILGKEERKIIGYKAPFDMGGGEIKKDDIFINDDWYIRESDGSFGFPKELVEAFFIPVYEEEEKVIELHGYRISKDKITICDGNINIEIEDFKYLTNIRNEVLKAYEELNK